ncbi:hypothetical protein LTR08_006685 [Meristemomyces frigidus]|nr:hypothetical protein LTR08_006685 [Meristemomyces frigidus]
MFRRAATLCPFCEATAALRPHPPQWRPTRPLSTLQKRKPPSRMTLSPNVARGAPRPKPARPRSRNSPFGGMNITAPPREYQYDKRNISAAEQRRVTRHAPRQAKGGKEAKDPMKALKMQRALSNVSYEKRGSVKQALLERDSFDEFDLLPVVREAVVQGALAGLADVTPTPIQRLALPALLGMDDGRRRKRKEGVDAMGAKREMQQFLLAAETGSGKTLAYALPVIDALKRAEQLEDEAERTALAAKLSIQAEKKASQLFELDSPPVEEPLPTTGRPRAIILLPTAELVAQVGALLKTLSHTTKFRSAMISTAYTSAVIRSRLFAPSGVDVVISTPHLLSSIAAADPNLLSRVTHLVIDEADSLLDRSFAPTTQALIDRATPSLHQLVLCSATIPRSLDAYVQKRFPAATRLVTPNLHAIPRRVQLSVVDIEKVPYQGNRDLACAQTIWDIGKEAAEEDEGESTSERASRKIVVFVNEREKTLELAEYLRSKGVDATALSRDSDERKQTEILAAFTGAVALPANQKQKMRAASSDAAISPADLPHTPSSSSYSRDRRDTAPFAPFSDETFSPVPNSHGNKRHLANTSVLVMTDLGSRGIDTLLVRHVILYDVPHTSIDFIHRLGRVGRMGRRGRGVVLVGRQDRRDVVREVREGMFRGQALI